MADFAWVIGGIVMTFFLVTMFSGIAVHNARFGQSIDCPIDPQALEEVFTGNNTALDIVFKMGTGIAVLASPCAGLPWWVYLFIFVPLTIGVAVWLTPLIGQ